MDFFFFGLFALYIVLGSQIYHFFFMAPGFQVNLKNFSCSKAFVLFFFWCGPFLKSLLTFLQYCFCFIFWPQGIWDLSSLSRDRTLTPCVGRWLTTVLTPCIHHWTSRDILAFPTLFSSVTFVNMCLKKKNNTLLAYNV